MGELKDSKIKQFIKKHRCKIRRLYNPRKLIFFGSRVRGEALKTSDIDLIIVSDAFKGVPYPIRISDFFIKLKLSENVDVICLTPEEFAERSTAITIVREAVREGKVFLLA